MDVIVRSVHKHWLWGNSASTLVFKIPKRHVIGCASLAAVQAAHGEEVFAQVLDARGAGFWTAPAFFGGQTTLEATTDLLVLRVFAPAEATAAATGTFFLSRAVGDTIDPGRDRRILAGIAEHAAWVAPGRDGQTQAVLQYVRLDGADSGDEEFLERYLDRTADYASALRRVSMDAGLLADPGLRLDG
jgi:hypothetical protein